MILGDLCEGDIDPQRDRHPQAKNHCSSYLNPKGCVGNGDNS